MKRMNKVTVGFLTVLFLIAVTVIPIYAAETKAPSLMPDGNMTLVDDYVIGDTQYITVQIKNGNYFYIIIDRSGETENVHFLNKVDEADLLPLLDEEFDFGTEPETPEEPTEPLEPDVTDKSEKQKEILMRGLVLAGIFAAIGGGIYIISKKKPKTETKKSKNDDDDTEDAVSENTYVRDTDSDSGEVTGYENDANEDEDDYEDE